MFCRQRAQSKYMQSVNFILTLNLRKKNLHTSTLALSQKCTRSRVFIFFFIQPEIFEPCFLFSQPKLPTKEIQPREWAWAGVLWFDWGVRAAWENNTVFLNLGDWAARFFRAWNRELRKRTVKTKAVCSLGCLLR